MAGPRPQTLTGERNPGAVKISSFKISGLFDGREHEIRFPEPDESRPEPSILILSGENGSGKTTILRMLSGMLELDFNMFRRTPFLEAKMTLSNGDELTVTRRTNPEYPLLVKFRDFEAVLYKTQDQTKLSPEQNEAREKFREVALPVLQEINFELLDIYRTIALRSSADSPADGDVDLSNIPPEYLDAWRREQRRRLGRLDVTPAPVAARVKSFVRDAQVNYRRFFAADELSLLPRILERFKDTHRIADRVALLQRIKAVQDRYPLMKRFGLQTDDADLNALAELLADDAYQEAHALSLLETYVEMQENQNKARELIAERLEIFESIMSEFLMRKSIQIHARDGLVIQAGEQSLRETDLSSGEYHFLYMMVSALLCQRSGSIIAIDEPELSLHVTWQRKVLGALARCAARASPIFIFATHSAAISAEYADRVYSLTPVE